MSEQRKKKKTLMKQNMIVIPVIAFALISWLVWWVYPNISSIGLAFQDRQGNFTTQNFKDVWKDLTSATGSGLHLGEALGNTMWFFFVSVGIRIPLVTFVTYFLYKRIVGYKFYRIIFYLPAIIPAVALSGTFKSFISVTGPLGKLCDTVGITMSNEGLLNSPDSAVSTVTFYIIWTCISGGMLVTNGAMARIPPEVLESAKIEGCGLFREFVQIVVPLIWPTITTLVILACTGIIAAGGDTIMLLSDSPQTNGTITLHYWMFKRVYGNGNGRSGDYGLVSAMGLLFTAVLIPFTFMVRKVLGKVEAIEY